MPLLQLHISINHIRPEIWRRIIVYDKTTLYQLHHILQIVFGWQNYHLYYFKFSNLDFGDQRLWENENSSMLDVRDWPAGKLLKEEGERLYYEYDIGDSWGHTVILEKIILLSPDSTSPIPICTGGARNAPPEDVGSIPGYQQLLQALKKPRSQEFREYKEWLGKVYDTEECDIIRINEGLLNLSEYIRKYETGL
ncbi:MAG TPA: plasmid pRiA4b ORF-3 family protein [Bacteroidales bacterium]|nr:plasmid pRiA4b ORF-3 family protein [Bacteroidales bacterium]